MKGYYAISLLSHLYETTQGALYFIQKANASWLYNWIAHHWGHFISLAIEVFPLTLWLVYYLWILFPLKKCKRFTAFKFFFQKYISCVGNNMIATLIINYANYCILSHMIRFFFCFENLNNMFREFPILKIVKTVRKDWLSSADGY